MQDHVEELELSCCVVHHFTCSNSHGIILNEAQILDRHNNEILPCPCLRIPDMITTKGRSRLYHAPIGSEHKTTDALGKLVVLA